MRAPKILMAIGMLWIFSTTSLISCGGTSKKTYTISGTVSGAIATGVGVSLSGDATASTVTDAAGAYIFSGLANGSYTVTPGLTDYTFAPVSIPVVVSNANMPNQNFVATKNVSCDDVCAKIGGTNAGECNSVTNTTVADCTTECNSYDSVVTTDTFNEIANCILAATCDVNMFTTCLTTVANSMPDALPAVESSACDYLVNTCHLFTDTNGCLSVAPTLLAQYSSYLSFINLVKLSTLNCVETCFPQPNCPTLVDLSTYSNAVISCVTNTCNIPISF